MQVLHDNFFFSRSRVGADGSSTLADERQLLAEEQKLCKVRARKFSLETNRRRKALEERQKQWDVQEQRLRENILQQRRQRVQDATERFQRAHLPLSQRRKQCSPRRNVPNIEEALSQIQGTMSSYTLQSSHLASKYNIYRSCTNSPKPPAVSKSSNRQALSAVEAYTKCLQEHSTTCSENSQVTEEIQEKQQDHTLQESHLSDSCSSESLSSKDSITDEDPTSRTKMLQSSFLSILLNSEKPHPVLGKQNDLYPTSDLTTSAMMLLGDNLLHSTKLHELEQKKDSEGPNSKIYVSKSSWEFTSEQTPKSVTPPSLHNCNLLPFCEIIGADSEHFDANSPQIDLDDNIIVTNRVTPTTTALESLCLKQESLLDLRQQRVLDDRQLQHPSATEILLPAKNGNNKDILFGSAPESNIFLNGSTIYNVSQEGAVQQTGKENHLSSHKESSASINNLNKVSSSQAKIEMPVNTTLLQDARLSNIQSGTFKCLHRPEEEVQKGLASVRFLKGILKKQSKYISDDTACVCDSGHLIFAKQLALEIRDSVELTRAKTKEGEGNKTVKKKLRWLDEVHMEKEDKVQNIIKWLSQSNSNLEDHQMRATTVSGASKPGPIMTPASSTGYHFTKQAWADVGVQVSLPQEQADEVKVPQSSTRTPKVPRRERPARVGVGPVSSRTRKGTVIRPQSATEVSQIAKTQGKLVVPRPPPRMEEKMAHVTKTPYGTEHASVICKQALAADQVVHKNNSEGFSSSYTHHGIRTDSTVMYTPLAPSLEGNMKGTPSSGHQEPQGCSRSRATMFGEKGLCLDCTPTDEEISQLWHGVRSALATKEAKTMLSRQALESGRGVRKPCVEQSRPPPASGNRRLPQPSQATKQTAESVKMSPSIYDVGFPREGLQSAAHLHMSQVHAEGRLEERDVVAAMETAQTQRSGMVQQCSQQQGLTTISLEEQRILMSLDRLNHQLHCVQEHAGGNTGTLGLVVFDAPSTKKVKVSTHHKHRASSTSNCAGYQKRIGL